MAIFGWAIIGFRSGTALSGFLKAYYFHSFCFYYLYYGCFSYEADDGVHGRELWESDGTGDGTRLAADINPGGNHGEPGGFVEFNNMMLFSAYDKEHGYEVWRCMP
jgi:ELWxxDGT repeat protein